MGRTAVKVNCVRSFRPLGPNLSESTRTKQAHASLCLSLSDTVAPLLSRALARPLLGNLRHVTASWPSFALPLRGKEESGLTSIVIAQQQALSRASVINGAQHAHMFALVS